MDLFNVTFSFCQLWMDGLRVGKLFGRFAGVFSVLKMALRNTVTCRCVVCYIGSFAPNFQPEAPEKKNTAAACGKPTRNMEKLG